MGLIPGKKVDKLFGYIPVGQSENTQDEVEVFEKPNLRLVTDETEGAEKKMLKRNRLREYYSDKIKQMSDEDVENELDALDAMDQKEITL